MGTSARVLLCAPRLLAASGPRLMCWRLRRRIRAAAAGLWRGLRAGGVEPLAQLSAWRAAMTDQRHAYAHVHDCRQKRRDAPCIKERACIQRVSLACNTQPSAAEHPPARCGGARAAERCGAVPPAGARRRHTPLPAAAPAAPGATSARSKLRRFRIRRELSCVNTSSPPQRECARSTASAACSTAAGDRVSTRARALQSHTALRTAARGVPHRTRRWALLRRLRCDARSVQLHTRAHASASRESLVLRNSAVAVSTPARPHLRAQAACA
jgi:hypothetical protein